MSDAHWVRWTLRGREDAYAKLVERYYGTAMALGYSRLRSHTEAEEIAQEAFVRAYERLDTLEKAHKFGPWLVGIVRNCIGRRLEGRLREASYAEATAGGEGASMPDVEERELQALVRARIDELDASHREVLLLYYFSGHSTRDIARLLDMSAPAVRKRLERARKQLGKRLLEDASGAFEASKERVKKIMGLVAASAAAWRGTAQAAPGLTLGGALSAKGLIGVVLLVTGLAALLAFRREPEPDESRATESVAGAQVAESDDAGAGGPAAAPNDGTSSSSETEVAIADAPAGTQDAEAASQGTVAYPVGGLVVDWGGEAVSGARVQATVKRYQRLDVFNPVLGRATTRTDEMGVFRFDSLPFEFNVSYWVEVSIESDKGFLFQPLLLPTGTYMDLHPMFRLRPSRPFAGTVVDEAGRPVAGATIRPIRFESKGWGQEPMYQPLPGVGTNPQGGFAFEHLYEGRWRFLLAAKGFQTSLTGYMDIEDSPEQLTLETGKTLQGRVVLPNGSPPGEAVTIGLKRASYTSGDLTELLEAYDAHRTVLSDDGTFVFESLRPGEYTVWIEDERLAYAGEAIPILIPEEGPAEDAVIPIDMGGVIEGRLHDLRTLEGVAGVTLRARLSDEDWQSLEYYRDARTAVTDEDGRYRITGLRKGSYTLYYDPNESLPAVGVGPNQPLSTSIDSAGGRETVDWPIDRRIAIRGRVVDPEGRPVPEAWVNVTPQPSPHAAFISYFGWGHRSDEDGRFSIYFSRTMDNLILMAAKPGLTSFLQGPVSAAPGSPDVVITVHPAGALSGMIESRNVHRPLAGFGSGDQIVRVRGEHEVPQLSGSWPGPVNWQISPRGVFLSNSGLGRFYFGNLPPDTYTLGTEAYPDQVTVRLGPGEVRDDLVLKAEPEVPSGPMVECRVTFAGKPEGECQVFYGHDDGWTGPDGSVLLAEPVEPNARLRVFMSRRSQGMAIQRRLSAMAGAPALGARPIAAPFGRGTGSVQGRVFLNGEAWQYCRLELRASWADGFEETLEVETNTDGAYAFDRIPAGVYEVPLGPNHMATTTVVRVSASDGRESQQDIEISAGRIRVRASGIGQDESGRLRVLPGEVEVGEVTVERLNWLRANAVVDVELNRSQPSRSVLLSEGVYTVYVAAYDPDAGPLAAILPTIRYGTARVEVGRGTDVAVDFDVGAR